MTSGFHLPGLARARIGAFERLGFVEDRESFSRPLTSPGQPIVESQVMIDDFNPAHPGVPILDELPPQAEEAASLMLVDMGRVFEDGSYVLRFLFRQGDVRHSLDRYFDLPHRDLRGNSIATYIVNDEDPTIARVDGRQATGDPYQLVRLRGDVLHHSPPNVRNSRTTLIGNITDRQTFDAIDRGALARLTRANGTLKPVRYPERRT